MSGKMTVTEMLATLGQQVEHHQERQAFHGQQETFHAEQEALHREEKARHTAELAVVSERLATLRAAVTAAQEVLRLPAAPPVPDDSDLTGDSTRNKALTRLLDSWPAGETYGAKAFTAAFNRRFAKTLAETNVRAVSQYLHRRAEARELKLVRAGKAYFEALFRKEA